MKSGHFAGVLGFINCCPGLCGFLTKPVIAQCVAEDQIDIDLQEMLQSVFKSLVLSKPRTWILLGQILDEEIDVAPLALKFRRTE